MDTCRRRVPWLFSGILKRHLPFGAPSERCHPRKDGQGSKRVSQSLSSLNRVFSSEPKARVCRGLRAPHSCRGTHDRICCSFL